MGYGVGMGLILDGKVYHGPTGAAAEFGHMNHLPGGALCRCGRRGCVEAYAADYGILRSAGTDDDSTPPPLSGVPVETMRKLESQARAGEPRAMEAYRKAGQAVGYGLARLVALLNPTRIVLSGPGTHAIELIRPHLMQAVEDGVVAELRQQCGNRYSAHRYRHDHQGNHRQRTARTGSRGVFRWAGRQGSLCTAAGGVMVLALETKECW